MLFLEKETSVFVCDRVSCGTGWPEACCIAEDAFELLPLLPATPDFQDYGYTPLHPVLCDSEAGVPLHPKPLSYRSRLALH